MNWMLAFTCLVAIGLSAMAADSTASGPKPVQRVEVKEFAKWVEKKDTVLLDVRTGEEFKDGHIKDARNFDIHSENFAANIAKLDKSKTYLVYCAAGGRSAQACRKMTQMGFTNLVDLASGFSGWKAARLPYEK